MLFRYAYENIIYASSTFYLSRLCKKYGGADKLDHMYIAYLSTHGLSYCFEKLSVQEKKRHSMECFHLL